MARFADRSAALLGGFALIALLASMWPEAGIPAWPAAMLGLLAIGLTAFPGGVIARAIASVAGFVAVVGALAQIALLWVIAGAMS